MPFKLKTMDIRQLRIGNLVLLLDEETKITTKDLALMETSPNVVGRLYKPIPLTEEWLLKFGFQRHDEGCVSAQFSYGINPVTQDYLIYLKWIKDYENDYQLIGFPFYQNGYFEIKTVHQLQNLYFSLCGEELELK